LGRSAEEEGGCDWFEWAEMDDEGENVHPLRNKKREVQDPADTKGPAEYEE
jgi:hypothetical protein